MLSVHVMFTIKVTAVKVREEFFGENSVLNQDEFVKHNAPDNGQFQGRQRSQGQIF